MPLRKSDIAVAVATAEKETFVIGESVFIRTVTYHSTGRIVRVSQCGATTFVHLTDAAWIPESGRWANTIGAGELKEVEPVTSEVRINVASIVDVYAWDHPLPRQQK